ncbi:hypothetical protein PABG_12627 [Paracoccidioides brasiliensis Pb03]|nr:hypothetical protein PABG_12627 [Paracoccidioides brasiliensis Pb03]
MAKYINFGAAGVTGLLYTSPAIFLDLPGSDHHGAGRCAVCSSKFAAYRPMDHPEGSSSAEPGSLDPGTSHSPMVS